MTMTDPIADLLTRIRNAAGARHATCEVSSSKMKERIVRILHEEGYVETWSTSATAGDAAGDAPPGGASARSVLSMTLKYRPDGRAAIRGLKRVSRPGRRVYCSASEAPKVLNGLGISILSTSRGVVTDTSARRLGVGGEVICNVW